MDQNDLLKEFIENETSGKEPIRLLKDVSTIEAWSNIPKYMVMIITQLKLLNDNLETNMINEQILSKYLELRLSADGYARDQFAKAHAGLNDKGLTPILAGMLPEQNKGLER